MRKPSRMRDSAQTAKSNRRKSDSSKQSFHSTCFACGSVSLQGLKLEFQQNGDVISGKTTIEKSFQSYEGIAHGGILTTLLDAAMVRCLFNIFHQQPFTCRLDVRFRNSVPTGVPIEIKARFLSKRSNRCTVEAEIHRKGKLCAQAHGVFMLR